MHKYITITIGFGCNNKCIFCVIGDTKNNEKQLSVASYFSLLKKIVKDKKYNSLILSGGEITCIKNLSSYVLLAKKLNYFKNIRIQTNGRLLKDLSLCKTLISSGVTEFFISINGYNESQHDFLSGVNGSFKETLAGIKNLNSLGVKIITNTVINTHNYTDIEKIYLMLKGYNNIFEFNFWNYMPIDENDSNNLIVDLNKIRDIFEKIEFLNNGKKSIKLFNFPNCFLYELGLEKYKLITPFLVTNKTIYNNIGIDSYLCPKKSDCNNSLNCSLLHAAYINKFGFNFLKGE